jgi:hypothetical protein
LFVCVCVCGLLIRCWRICRLLACIVFPLFWVPGMLLRRNACLVRVERCSVAMRYGSAFFRPRTRTFWLQLRNSLLTSWARRRSSCTWAAVFFFTMAHR